MAVNLYIKCYQEPVEGQHKSIWPPVALATGTAGQSGL